MKTSTRNALRKYVPMRLRRIYRRYISPVVRDEYHAEFAARKAFFERAFSALSFNGIDGDYVEFGCCGGMTFGLAYRYSRKQSLFCKLWAFDSFCGLPPQVKPADEHPAWIQGTMSMEADEFKKACGENGIPASDFEVVEGYYEQTLSGQYAKKLPTNICLAYVDCDLYSSAKTVLEFLMPRLKHGMIIAFDDYYCWSATQVSGERKACAEFFRDSEDWVLVPFLQYGGGGGGMSFVVENKRLGGTSGSCY